MSLDTLETVIEESVEDATPVEEPEVVEESNTSAEQVEMASTPAEEPVEPVSEETQSATDAKADDAKPQTDDFEKKYGIPAQSTLGRENRIPYSRVKKIVEKGVNDAVAAKVKEYEPKIQEYETKIKAHEEREQRVASFEDVMVNKPERFLQLLSTLPAYQNFFKAIEAALEGKSPQQQASQQEQVKSVPSGRPEPDQVLPDGTRMYSMEGLDALLAWQAKQVEDRVTKQVEDRYKPMESAWQADQRVQAIIPQIQAQIADARTWPMFNEHEEEVVKVLQSNPQISLEGAYRQVVFPKMVADRNKLREEILKELKQAPKTTVATSQASRSTAQASTGSRSLEEIIAEQIKGLR